jgi:hypothetical protein
VAGDRTLCGAPASVVWAGDGICAG